MLFKKFGEFDSVEELNRAAAGQLEQGDIEALKALAKENGIEEEDIEDYINGDVEELATPIMAAIGRVKIEREEAKKFQSREKIPCLTIASLMTGMLTDESFARKVMKKGKRIHEITKIMYEERCFMGTDRDLQEIVFTYYDSGIKKMKEKINEIKARYEEA